MDAETLPKAVAEPPLGTAATGASAGLLRFDRFELDLARGTVSAGGQPIPLRPKTFSLLCHLLAHPGRLVSKDELLDNVWPDVVVTEDSVIQCVGELRAALGDREQQLIKTAPRRGYILDVSVQRLAPPSAQEQSETSRSGQPLSAQPPDTTSPAANAPGASRHRRPMLAGLALAVLLLAALAWWRAEPAAPAGIDQAIAARRTVAVLPFADLSEPAAPAFSEAVVDDLNLAISRIPETLVIARGSTASFVGPKADAQVAGRTLRATHVLTGSLQRNGEAVLIRIQLQRSDSGALLWGERFEYQGAAQWGWQRDIAERVANSLNARLHDANKPPSDYAGVKPNAIDAAQQGFYLLRHFRTRDEILRARALFETALAADPNSVVALTGRGLTYTTEVSQRWSMSERQRHVALAAQDFDRAIALRPDYALAHHGRSHVLYQVGKIDEAAIACEQTLALWPNYTYALLRLGFYRLQQGRPAEVAAPVQLAMRINPLELPQVAWGHFYIGMAKFHLRRDDEAYEEMRKAVAANANNGFGFQWMAAIDALHGRDEAAKVNLAAFQKLMPGHSVSGLKATEPAKSPIFWAERERFYEGLTKAGLPP
jgi:DNA-binding winged helix-turn-helix (wHTH) protein/TolB-like protein